jgi:hypothetical protein
MKGKVALVIFLLLTLIFSTIQLYYSPPVSASIYRPTSGDAFECSITGLSDPWEGSFDNDNATAVHLYAQTNKWGRYNFSTPVVISGVAILATGYPYFSGSRHINVTKVNVTDGTTWRTAWRGNISWMPNSLDVQKIDFNNVYRVSQMRIQYYVSGNYGYIYEVWVFNTNPDAQVSTNGTTNIGTTYATMMGNSAAEQTTLYDNSTTSDGQYKHIYQKYWYAQTFTPGGTHVTNKIGLRLSQNISAQLLRVSIRNSTTSGKPGGGNSTNIASKFFNVTMVPSGFGWYNISIPDTVLAAGVKYAIVVAVNRTTSNKLRWAYVNDGSGYLSGDAYSSTNYGSSWTQMASSDFVFRDYGYEAAVRETVVAGTGVYPTSGYYTLSYNAGDLSKTWDGTAYPIKEYYTSGDNGAEPIFGTKWGAQSFWVPTGHYINWVSLHMYRFGSPGKISVSIRALNASKQPTGLDLTKGTIDGANLTTSDRWWNITMPAYYLIGAGGSGADFAIVVRAESGDGANYVVWKKDTSPTYSHGSSTISYDGGTAWENISADFLFKEGSPDSYIRFNPGSGFCLWNFTANDFGGIRLTASGNVTDGMTITSICCQKSTGRWETAWEGTYNVGTGWSHRWINFSVVEDVVKMQLNMTNAHAAEVYEFRGMSYNIFPNQRERQWYSDTGLDIYVSQKGCQTFEVYSEKYTTFNISTVEIDGGFYLDMGYTYRNFFIGIYNVDPLTQQPSTCIRGKTVNASTLPTPTSYIWRQFRFPRTNLSTNTKYAVVVRYNGSTGTFFSWGMEQHGSYDNGRWYHGDATNWKYTAYPMSDFAFNVTYQCFGKKQKMMTSSDFEYGATTAYGYDTANVNANGSFSINQSGLLSGQVYHFRSRSSNDNNFTFFYGSDSVVLTRPGQPYSCQVTGVTRSQLNLSWSNPARFNKTIIVRKVNYYPLSLTDGTIVYNGSGSSYQDTGLVDETIYRYSFWSWSAWNGTVQLRQFSAFSWDAVTSGTTLGDIYPQFAGPTATSVHQKAFFNVTYSDPDSGAPQQFYCRIWIGSTTYNNSMQYKSGNNYTGALYSYNRTLASGLWCYKFLAFDGTHWNETVQMTVYVSYNVSFGFNFPSWLVVGEYILTFGSIANGTLPLQNIWVHTRILDNDSNLVAGSYHPFYVVNGIYMYSFSTSTMIPGLYTICLNFTLVQNIWMNQSLYLSYSGSQENPGPGHTPANLYYTFFNRNTGMQLSDDFYKLYISTTTSFTESNRVKYGTYATYQGQRIYYKVKDYWNNLVYPENGSYSSFYVTSGESYLDIAVAANEFLVKNSNDSVVYFKLTNGPINGTGNTWYARWVPPQESTDVFLRTGMYNFTLQYYDPVYRTLAKTIYLENFYIDADVFYWVPGWKLSDVVISLYNVNSSLLNQLVNIGVYVNNFNSTVLNQAIGSSVWLQNLNTTIANQLIYMVQNISNWNTTIKNQWIAAIQNITNMRSNITNQISSVDQHITNLNSNLINQSNLIRQEIYNLNVTMISQINGVLQNITILASNITNQANLVGQWITNLNASIREQMNVLKQDVDNLNSSIQTQMNIIEQGISNLYTNITSQLNLLSQDVENVNGTIYEQANVVEQMVTNTRTTIINQLNGVWQTINNSESIIVNQISGVWASVNNTNVSANLSDFKFNMTQFENISMNFTGFDSLMLKMRAILSQFQLPHGWQIPNIEYTINDTTPPISTITAYVGVDGTLQVSYWSTDNSVFGVAYVNLYYKIGTNATYWRNWSIHGPQSAVKTFNGEDPENGTTYWFKCIATDVYGNIELPSDTNTINITYFYSGTQAMEKILPLDSTTILYVMMIAVVCIILGLLYSVYRRRKEEKMLQRQSRGPRQPLH